MGRLAANGIPQLMIDQFTAQGGGNQALELTGTGDIGAQILESLPPEASETFPATVAGFGGRTGP